MTRYSFLLLLLFLLPYPILGQTIITTDTTLTQDHIGSIIIDADGITLDCGGFTVSGTGSGNGIALDNKTGVTVKKCNVEGFNHGFRIDDSNYNTFTQNISENNFGFPLHGFRISDSNHNTFTQNISEHNGEFGFGITNSDNNTFSQNISGNNGEFGWGFGIAFSDNNTFTQNISEHNGEFGFRISDSDGNTFTENTSSGNGVNGFLVTGTSTLNAFRENEGFGNGIFDAEDQTGMDNIWEDNDFGTTSGF